MSGDGEAFEEERGAFDERREADPADRAMPSVAEGRSVGGAKTLILYAAVILGAGFLVLLTVDFGGSEARTLTAPQIVDDRSRARDSAPAFPGLGFDLAPPPEEAAPRAAPPPVGETAEERTLRLARERQALEADRARLAAELEAEKQARELRLDAARMQIDAAREAEAERVKRLRSNVLIMDASGKDDEGGPRDIPPAPDGEDAAGDRPDGAPDLTGAAATGEAAPDAATPFPPALVRTIAEGQRAGDDR